MKIPDNYKYVSIDDCFRSNGHRHLERAIAYASAQYPEHYYQGSMQKALKNYKKADSLKLPKYLDETIKYLGKLICDNILNGTK